jgi:hypothetical protein
VILAVITKMIKGREVAITLDEKRWSAPEAPALARVLNHIALPEHFGPECGDPVTWAANQAAEQIQAMVTFIREPEPSPPDKVF